MKHGNDAGQDTQGLKHKLKKTDRLGQARQAVKLQKQDRNGVRHVRHQARAHQSKACSQKGPDIARKQSRFSGRCRKIHLQLWKQNQQISRVIPAAVAWVNLLQRLPSSFVNGKIFLEG